MPRNFVKDPNSVLDYVFDFAAETNGTGTGDWLATSETISTRTVTVDTGITKDSDSITDTNTSVTVWLSGGTAGVAYTVVCKAVTSVSRTVERSIVIYVEDR